MKMQDWLLILIIFFFLVVLFENETVSLNFKLIDKKKARKSSIIPEMSIDIENSTMEQKEQEVMRLQQDIEQVCYNQKVFFSYKRNSTVSNHRKFNHGHISLILCAFLFFLTFLLLLQLPWVGLLQD